MVDIAYDVADCQAGCLDLWCADSSVLRNRGAPHGKSRGVKCMAVHGLRVGVVAEPADCSSGAMETHKTRAWTVPRQAFGMNEAVAGAERGRCSNGRYLNGRWEANDTTRSDSCIRSS